MLFITGFSAAILNAFSLNQILKRGQNEKFFKVIIWSFAILVGVFLGTLIAFIDVSKSSHNIVKNAPTEFFKELYLKTPDLIQNNLKISLRNTILPIVIICFLIISYLFVKQFKKNITLIFYILIVLLVFDLGRYFLKFNPFVSQDLIFPKTPSLKFLEDQPGIFRIGREHAEVLPPNTWSAYNLYSFEGYDPFYLNQYAKFINFLNSGNIKSGADRYAELVSNYKSNYLNAANVKYFIAVLRDQNRHIPGNVLDKSLRETGYKPIFKGKSSVILQNPNAEERIYFAKKVIVASDEEVENKFMKDRSFNPKRIVMLSENLHASSITGKGAAKITYYSPNKIVIDTATKSDEILVLADQYDDGWKAEIDGNNTKISRANLIFRAIKVPSGLHRIVFSYYPKSFDIGLKITLASLFGIFILSLFLIKIRKF